jgi:phage N-6-adenine-methyltransferase
VSLAVGSQLLYSHPLFYCMNTELHFSSKTDQWATPQDFFDTVSKEFGGFDLDVCASAENTKCALYFSKEAGTDSLTIPWKIFDDECCKCWMNPPYGREIKHWIKKASDESRKGCLVVALLPARTDTHYFHDYIYNKPGVETRFIKGRLKFGGSTNSAPFPSMLVIFHPSQAQCPPQS